MAIPGSDTVYDLTILYMSDVTNWCEYLFDIFNPFEVYQQSEEITDFPTHESTIQNIKNSRVQVLIISPKFIETVTPQICDVTGKKSVVGLLCGVEEEELVRLKDRIPDYESWNLVDAKDGPQKITQVTLEIVDFMIKEADKPANLNQSLDDDEANSHYITMTGGTKPAVQTEDDEYYTTMAKIHAQTEADGADDDLYLRMGDTGATSEPLYLAMDANQQIEDIYDIPGMSESTYDTYNFPPSAGAGTLPIRTTLCTVYPDRVRAGVREKVAVVFKNTNMDQDYEGSYKIHIAFDKTSRDVVATVVNPYTLRFETPNDLPGGYYKCTLTHNGTQKATFKLNVQKASAALSELLRDVMNPVTFLTDLLDLSPANTSSLDHRLHDQCKHYIPPAGFKNHLPVKVAGGKASALYPTALHLAAELGLMATCATLCQWPGADQALSLANSRGLTPEQMTKHENLQSFLISQKEQGGGVPGHNRINDGYVSMSKDPGNVDDGKSIYKRPFPVPIPIADEDIKKVIEGDVDDIYSYYGTPTSLELNKDEDEDDDTQETYLQILQEDYETLDTTDNELPGQPLQHPREPPMVGRRPPPASSNPSSPVREQDIKLQHLIEIQNKVKENKINMEEAITLFKEWEKTHKSSSSQNPNRQSRVQKFISTKFFKEPRGIPPIASSTGPRTDLPLQERSDKPMPGAPRPNVTNGNSENANGKLPDPSRGDTDASRPAEPVPRRSPRKLKDPNSRKSWKDHDFSSDYMDRPIPPIPPRIQSSSNYARLPAGARSVLPDPRNASIPEHSDQPDVGSMPPRSAPPPPRRSSQDKHNSLEGPRRQSDPSVTANKDGDPPPSPGPDRTKRPTPRPRGPRPKPN